MPLERAFMITHGYYYILLYHKIKNAEKYVLHSVCIALKTNGLQPEDFNRTIKYNLIYFPALWKLCMREFPADREQVV